MSVCGCHPSEKAKDKSLLNYQLKISQLTVYKGEQCGVRTSENLDWRHNANMFQLLALRCLNFFQDEIA